MNTITYPLKVLSFIVLSLTLCNAQTTTGSGQKLAHVDVESIFVDLPETKEARRELQEFEKIKSQELGELQLEFQKLVRNYETEVASASKEVAAALVKEIQDKELRINQFTATISQEIKKKEADLLRPILDKLKQTIVSIGRKQGFQYVFDTSMLLLSDGKDLTRIVRKELGLQ